MYKVTRYVEESIIGAETPVEQSKMRAEDAEFCGSFEVALAVHVGMTTLGSESRGKNGRAL